MEDIGFWEGIVRDLSGKGQFRLFVQPSMAILLGIRIGLSDAKKHITPFFPRLLQSKRQQRWALLGQSVRYAWIPLTLALVTDGIFQHLTLGRIRVLAAIIVGILLVWLPFTIARGLTNRIWSRSQAHRQKHAT